MLFNQRKTHVKCLLSFCVLLAVGEFYSAEVKYLVKCFSFGKKYKYLVYGKGRHFNMVILWRFIMPFTVLCLYAWATVMRDTMVTCRTNIFILCKG